MYHEKCLLLSPDTELLTCELNLMGSPPMKMGKMRIIYTLYVIESLIASNQFP